MKSEILKETKAEEKNVYPCLMQDENTKDVILFLSESCGVCVYSSGERFDFGDNYATLDISDFIKFTGTVQLLG